MKKSNYLILILLILIFVAPGLSAYLYYRNPQLLSAAKTNKGELLSPAVLFAELADGKSKWRLVYWSGEYCEIDCLNEVDKLARIRLALGRRLYEVDEWLVLAKASKQTETDLGKTLQDKDIHLLNLPSGPEQHVAILGAKPKIFIADPKGFLILAYENNANPDAIYQDLRQLLKKSG